VVGFNKGLTDKDSSITWILKVNPILTGKKFTPAGLLSIHICTEFPTFNYKKLLIILAERQEKTKTKELRKKKKDKLLS